MSDPVTIAMLGAGAGAMMDKDQPLRGAALGGIGGFAGGSMLGPAAAGSQAGMTGAGGYLGSNLALPTLGASTPAGLSGGLGLAGQGAAQMMPSAQIALGTGQDILPSMALSQGMGAAAPYVEPPGLISQLQSGIPSLPGNGKQMMAAGQLMQMANKQPQQNQPLPMAPPPAMPRPAPQSFNSPYQRQPMSYAQAQPSLLPGFRRY